MPFRAVYEKITREKTSKFAKTCSRNTIAGTTGLADFTFYNIFSVAIFSVEIQHLYCINVHIEYFMNTIKSLLLYSTKLIYYSITRPI